MADIALNVIGLLSGGILGILGLIPDDVISPDPLSLGYSRVRIGIGLDVDAKTNTTEWNMGGTIPSLRVFNENRELIGKARSSNESWVEAGKFIDITVTQNQTYQQPTYLQVAGGPNRVCIAYLGQTWSDGTKLGWLGDIGHYCGADWYWSNLYVATVDGTMYKPSCSWFGGNDDSYYNGMFYYTGIKIHTPDFGKLGHSNDFSIPKDPSSLCRYPSTQWYKRTVFNSAAPCLRPASLFGSALSVFGSIGSSLGASVPRFLGKSAVAGQESFRNSIIGSHDMKHSGKTLCSDSSSWGPDFVSFHEGVFCDMTRKKTWPLCSREVTRDCFDWETRALVDSALRRRGLGYESVVEWR